MAESCYLQHYVTFPALIHASLDRPRYDGGKGGHIDICARSEADTGAALRVRLVFLLELYKATRLPWL